MNTRTATWAVAGALVLAVSGCVPAKVVDRGPTTAREVTLTFDGAYDAQYAGAVLDVLSRYGVAATFFLTGEFAEDFPDVVTRMAAQGHLVANHSYDHPDFTTIDDARIAEQLLWADEAISARTNRSTKPYVRPPYGAQDERVNRVLGENGYRFDVLWTVDSLGWKGRTSSQVVARCIERAAPGTLYMFHLSARSDLDALPWIIQWLHDQGYRIVRLDTWFP